MFFPYDPTSSRTFIDTTQTTGYYSTEHFDECQKSNLHLVFIIGNCR